jgi:8-oxo-dGTP pyrophosphatase MutT (NUDIX family)
LYELSLDSKSGKQYLSSKYRKEGYKKGSGGWVMPGGGKMANENPEQCVRREVMEEAQCEVDDLKYLMTVWGELYNNDDSKVTDPEIIKNYRPQFRYIGYAKNMTEFIPEKDGFETVERKFISLTQLPEYFPWISNSESGREFYDFLKSRLDKMN